MNKKYHFAWSMFVLHTHIPSQTEEIKQQEEHIHTCHTLISCWEVALHFQREQVLHDNIAHT